ncbi:hypothetical protein MKW98_020478 [Papaver atlanticum]|uniref:Uncharacterized protein n=1 Tax=Papaver atlanticum TaxID=357466 RepID=A0AAD4X3G5_9MAGN|nr:hypothetical protein MKW98_020478 [Papaver atlanticum]
MKDCRNCSVYLVLEALDEFRSRLAHYTDPPAGKGNSFVSAIEGWNHNTWATTNIASIGSIQPVDKAWLREKQQQQDSLPKYANPVLLSADVKRMAESLDRFCRPVMTKPKPAAPKPPTPAESPSPPPQSTPEPQTDGADVDESAAEGDFAEGEPNVFKKLFPILTDFEILARWSLHCD